MQFYAIALVPGGNILGQLSVIKSRARAIAGSPDGLALPEGMYIGFFEVPAPGSKKELVRLFKTEAQGLFAGLPLSLRFGTAQYIGESAYLAPLEKFPRDPVQNALQFAGKAGLKKLENTPIQLGIGFFMGNHVTLDPVDAFSFSNMQALLLEIHSPSLTWDSAAWRLLCKQARKRRSMAGGRESLG